MTTNNQADAPGGERAQDEPQVRDRADLLRDAIGTMLIANAVAPSAVYNLGRFAIDRDNRILTASPRPAEPEPPKAEQGLGLRPDPQRERFVMEGVELTEEQIYDGLRPSQPKAEQEPIIQCPSCGCAGGNTVDRTRGLTLRCQYCGWPSQPKADAGTLEARLQDAMKFYDYNGGMVDLLRDVLTELHRRQELCLQLQQAKWESDAEARAQELRAEKAEARASSPDLRALVTELRDELVEWCHESRDIKPLMENGVPLFGGVAPERILLNGIVKKLESALTGTGEQK